ncbi:MAG TPA: hypothetical protein VN377_07050, partial [Candidatus Thermoplasmatota archaeon]|nr:hypothetical protein [Candidatus Thermoplasmatota archaeon]
MTSRPKSVHIVGIVCVVISLILSCGSITGVTTSSSSLEKKEAPGALLTYSSGCCEGYTLLNRATTTVLIDMNGTIIHRWPSHYPQPAKMLPGGSIIAGS